MRYHAHAAAAALLLAIAPANPASAADDEPSFTDTVREQARAIEQLARSSVIVEITPRYDRAEAPRSDSIRGAPLENFIREERPYELAGYLIDDRTVLCEDPIIPSRFIESINIRFGDQTVPASVSKVAKDQAGLYLTAESPIPGAQPLDFTDDPEPPFSAVRRELSSSTWHTSIAAIPSSITTATYHPPFLAVNASALVIDDEHRPVSFTFTGRLPADLSWTVDPNNWNTYSADELGTIFQRVEALAADTLPRISLNFRSPRKDPNQNMMNRWRGDSDDQIIQWNGSAVLLDESTILVPANLNRKATARLERIRVFFADGSPRTATFLGSLENYGGFLATLDEPAPRSPDIDDQDIRTYEDRLLVLHDVAVAGDVRIVHTSHARIEGFNLAWRNTVIPSVPPSADGSAFRGSDSGSDGTSQRRNFLFDTNAQLVAVPIARRQKVAVKEEWGGPITYMLHARHFASILDNVEEHIDPANIPLTEEEENRTAWLGVELQTLDPELARINGVADQTADGQTGAIVTYVYPGSPAESAGFQMGDILLRINAPSQPKPIDVTVGFAGFGGNFPWQMYSELPEEYFEQIPNPWPPADSDFNQTLTEIGFGQPVTITYARAGEIKQADIMIQESPTHYNSAPRHKDDELGLTVRDMTYEVRRYFQESQESPGVIISKIERGSKASTAGLKPYEIIKEVNGTPVHSVEQFEDLLQKGDEFRLNVKRMTQTRVVKIRVDRDGDDQTD